MDPVRPRNSRIDAFMFLISWGFLAALRRVAVKLASGHGKIFLTIISAGRRRGPGEEHPRTRR